MDLQQLRAPIERQLALLGFELVCLEAVKEGRDPVLRLYVDHLDPSRAVTLDDCVSVNDGLVAWLDVAFPSLREEVGLEISSPGLERPLTKPEHYGRFIGRLCRLQMRVPLQGQKRFKGWICSVSSETVTLEEDGTLKTIPLDAVQKSRLAPFEEDGVPQPKHVQRAGDGPGRQGDTADGLSKPGRAAVPRPTKRPE